MTSDDFTRRSKPDLVVSEPLERGNLKEVLLHLQQEKQKKQEYMKIIFNK